jgi:cytoskeletal protein CcmA (bactofilin family)
MIRMGRSSKTETPSEAPQSYEQPKTSYNYQTSESSNRAMSESESMARDIKEGRLSGFVGSGTMLTGETSFQAMLRVDGHLTGRVMSEAGTLIIGSTGRVDANIHVGTAMINGTVNGDIVATEKIELGRSARVIGNVQTPRLTIEDGAIFEGSCSMLKSREASDKRAHEAQRAATYAETAEQIEYADAEEKIEAAAS